MRGTLVLALAVALLALAAGSAFGDTGAFNGSFTATTCGPLHPISVAAGETNIEVVATADLPSNDIVLRLHHPAGTVVAQADTGTSPEAILASDYSADGFEADTYLAEVCPFDDPIVPIVAPTTYTGTFETRGGPPVGLPITEGSGTDPSGVKRMKGTMVFSPATVVDPQRTEGEPLNYIDAQGRYWESGPWGTSTAQSFIHRSSDNGLSFHVDSPVGLRPDPPPGGGDTDLVVDDQGFVYFVDLEALLNVGTSVSNDGGNTWRKNATAITNAGVDRQWYAIDQGPTSSAADNTVFLGVREVAVGIKIYSSPGSTGPSDPVGGLVWQDSSSSAPVPVASDTTCGQLRFDPVVRNLYYPCAVGDRVRVTIGHVNPGQRTGIAYRTVNGPASPGGGPVGDIFPALATDAAGNVYIAWIDESDHQVYFSSSSDAGSNWTTPIRVNSAPAVSNVFVWAHAGEPGSLAVAWYGTDRGGDSDDFPNWFDDPQGATEFEWFGYVAAITKATSNTPTIAQQRFTEKPMHYGQICNGGLGCTVSGGDRTMADFFAVALDREGALRFVYNDTTSQHHGAHVFEVRQVKGKLLAGSTINRPLPASPISDATGDAQWPHFSPTGAGPNLAQLDLTGVALGRPDANTLRVRMSAASLSSLAAPAGKTRSLWLTRFQALSTGSSGEESYPIFYVAAESAGGGAPTFFVGTTACTESTPGNCKVVQYPVQTAVQGRRCGNALVIDVPLAAFGRPVGGTLFGVTALTFGRNADTDLYADVDAAPSFDFALGSTASVPSC